MICLCGPESSSESVRHMRLGRAGIGKRVNSTLKIREKKEAEREAGYLGNAKIPRNDGS